MMVVEKLKMLVASERKITAEIIGHIQEIDQKKIYAQLGYPSLFSFLTEHIGYAAASAQRRIEASRLLTAVPEVKEDIRSGSLNLSQVALVAQMVRQKQKEAPLAQINSDDKKVLLGAIKNQNFESSQKIISQTLDLEIKQAERKVVQKDESVRLEVTLSRDQMEAINKVKSLISHINPSATMAEVFEFLAKDYLKRKDPARNIPAKQVLSARVSVPQARNTTSTPKTADTKNGGRYKSVSEAETFTSASEVENKPKTSRETFAKRKRIPLAIKRIVWQRDQGQCQHFSPATGKKCGSPYMLEVDHIKRVRHGGDNDPKNLRLLCHAHNHLRG